MAKKKRASKTSKGERLSISNGVSLVLRDPFIKGIQLIEAWRKGQNPWLNVEGPDRAKARVRVRANDYWGDSRRRSSLPTSVGESE